MSEMESHNISTNNFLRENTDQKNMISVTLTTPTKNIETVSKSSATTLCRNSLETELVALET